MNDTRKIPLQDLQNDFISDANKLKIKNALDSDIPVYLNDAEALSQNIDKVFNTHSTDVFPALTALLPDGIDDRVESHVTQVVIEYLDAKERESYNPTISSLRGIFQGNLNKSELIDNDWVFGNKQASQPSVSVDQPAQIETDRSILDEHVHVKFYLQEMTRIGNILNAFDWLYDRIYENGPDVASLKSDLEMNNDEILKSVFKRWLINSNILEEDYFNQNRLTAHIVNKDQENDEVTDLINELFEAPKVGESEATKPAPEVKPPSESHREDSLSTNVDDSGLYASGSPTTVPSGKTELSVEDLKGIDQELMSPAQKLWEHSIEGRSNIQQPSREFGEDVETIVPRASHLTDVDSLAPHSFDSDLDETIQPETIQPEAVDPVEDLEHLHTDLDSGPVWEIDTDESAQDVLESLMEQEFNLNEYMNGSVRMRARKGRDGANLRVFAETMALEVLEELVSESNRDASLQAVHKAIEEKMCGDIRMSDEALVALAIYFNVRGDVGTEKFEKEMSSKLVTVVGEELGLDFDVDMDEVEVENGFSGHDSMFKQKIYQKLYATYANQDLRDPEVRNKFTNELTLGMMQERLRLLQEREDHLQNNWSNKAMNGLRATASFLKQVGGPAALTLLLGASAYYGGMGTTLLGLGKLVTGIGTAAGSTSLASLVGSWFGMLGFKGAYGFGAAYMGGKTLSAFAKLKMPLMGLLGASAGSLDQNMLEMINAGASLRIGNDGLQVANMDESSKARKRKIKDIKKTFRQEQKATRKNAVQSLKDQEFGTRSEAIMSAINSTYSSVINMQSIGATKLDETKVAGELTSIGSSVAMFGLPSLFSLGYRKMRA